MVVVGILATLIAPLEIYVSPTGSDSAAGTQKAPLRTIEKAIVTARAKKIKKIVVRKGEYELSQSLTLGAADDGLVLCAAPGERPLITGTRKISSKQVHKTQDRTVLERIIDESARGKISEIDLAEIIGGPISPASPYGFPKPIIPTGNELFSGNTPFISARWPNVGFTKIKQTLETGNGEEDRQAAPRLPKFEGVTDRAKLWAKADDVWFYGYWKFDWADECIRAKSIDPESGVITLSSPHNYGVQKGAEYYAENLLEELDQPGELFIDRMRAKLYFIPKGAAAEPLRLSVLTTPLVKVEGAENILVRGIDFGFARGDGASVHNSRKVRFEGCQFYNLGMRAVMINGGSDDGLYGCNIWNTGEGGVNLTGGDRISLTPSHHYVENCDIHHYQRRTQTYRPAVSLNGVGNRVTHSAMHDAPHSAIIFGGNDHVIEYNNFYRTISRTGDGGVVYTGRDWTARGTRIEYNYFRNNVGIHKWEPAIYFDDCASGLTARGNVIENCHWGFLVGGGRDHLIVDNVIVDCKLGLQCDARGLGWFGKSKPTMVERYNAMPVESEVWKAKYPRLSHMLENDPMAPQGNILMGNVLVRSGKLLDKTEPKFKATTVYSRNAELESHGNWQKLPGVPKLPVEKMGLIVDPVRKTLPK